MPEQNLRGRVVEALRGLGLFFGQIECRDQSIQRQLDVPSRHLPSQQIDEILLLFRCRVGKTHSGYPNLSEFDESGIDIRLDANLHPNCAENGFSSPLFRNRNRSSRH